MVNIKSIFKRGSKIKQSTTIFKSNVEELMNADGKEHIRVDNRAKTLLGRMLDSQYIVPFYHPKLGPFNTTEGFWFYISMENPDERLRQLNGHEIRKVIRELRDEGKLQRVWIPQFDIHIKYANWLKITSNPSLLRMMSESKLPFKMYYIIDDEEKPILVEKDKLSWVITLLEEIRELIKITGDISSLMSPFDIPQDNYDEILNRIPMEVRKLYNI